MEIYNLEPKRFFIQLGCPVSHKTMSTPLNILLEKSFINLTMMYVNLQFKTQTSIQQDGSRY
jgi:hypothetical protein